MPVDANSRRRMLEFELEIDAAVADETIVAGWGRAFLSPSLPLVWDATSIVLEAPGLTMPEVAALADEVLGEAGFVHRTVAAGWRAPRSTRRRSPRSRRCEPS